MTLETIDAHRKGHAMNQGTQLNEMDADELRRANERERITRYRRKLGMKPMSERTKIADLQAIANLVGKSLRTLRRRDKAGNLNEYLASLGYDEAECRILIKHIH